MGNNSNEPVQVDVMTDKFGNVVCESDEVKVIKGWIGEVITIQMMTLSRQVGEEPVASVQYNGRIGQFVSSEIELVRAIGGRK